MVANVEAFVNKDRRVTLQEVANKFSISKTSDFTLKINVSKVSARWVPKQLKEDK